MPSNCCLDVVADEGDVAEEVAEGRDSDCPDESTEDVVGQEGSVAHASDAGNDRGEGPDDGHEASHEHGLCPVPIEEVVRFGDVGLFEEPRIFSREERGAGSLAEQVAHLVSGDGSHEQQREQDCDVGHASDDWGERGAGVARPHVVGGAG